MSDITSNDLRSHSNQMRAQWQHLSVLWVSNILNQTRLRGISKYWNKRVDVRSQPNDLSLLRERPGKMPCEVKGEEYQTGPPRAPSVNVLHHHYGRNVMYICNCNFHPGWYTAVEHDNNNRCRAVP